MVGVLIVDPNPAFAGMIQQVLEETGRFHATVVGSATQALEAASRAVFDVTLIEAAVADLTLPDLVTALRLNRPLLTVVVVLPFGEDSLPPSAQSLDIQAVLTKPLYIPDLQAQIEGALAKPVNGVVPPVRATAAPAPRPPAPPPIAPEPAPKASPSKRPAPPPAWLEDVNRAAQYLTTLTLESSAEAALLMRGQRLIAFAGQGGQAEADELSRMVAASWARESESGQGSQARFLRLSNGADYLVYSTLAAQDVVLSMAFQAETPLGQIRKQAKRATSALFAPPADGAPLPGTGPLPAAPVPPTPEPARDPLPQNAAPAAQPVQTQPAAVQVLSTPAAPEPAAAGPTPAPVDAVAAPAVEPVQADPAPLPADFNQMPAPAPDSFVAPEPAPAADAEPAAPALPFDPTLYERMMLSESGPARPVEWSAPTTGTAPEDPAAPVEEAEFRLPPSQVKTKPLPALPDFAPDMRGFPDPYAYKPEAAPSLDTRPLSEVPDTVTLADAIKAAPLPPDLDQPVPQQKDTMQAWLNLYQAETSADAIPLPPAAEPVAPPSPSPDPTPAPVPDSEGASWFNLYQSRTGPQIIALPPASEPSPQPDWSFPPPRLPADMPAVPPPEPEAVFPPPADELPAAPEVEEQPDERLAWARLPVTQRLPELPDWVPASPGRQLHDPSQSPAPSPAPEPLNTAGVEVPAPPADEMTASAPNDVDALPAFTPPFAPEDTPEADLDVEPLPDADALEALSRKLQALERQSLVEQPPLLDLPPAPWPNIRRTPHGLYDLSYSFIFVPRHGHVNLSGDIKGRLEHWLVSLAEFHDWEVTTLVVDDDHVEISLKCPPADSPERIMKTVLAETSDKIMEEYPRLSASHGKRPGAFWASGYYVVTPGRRFLPEEVQAFVEYQRREQGGKL